MVINLNNANKTKVNQLVNKNQFVIQYEYEGHLLVCFQSYTTLIAIYDYNTKELAINWLMWDYSKTTIKHLKLFINKYTCYEYNNKQQFLNELVKSNSEIERFKTL